jgi:hypothetical protein
MGNIKSLTTPDVARRNKVRKRELNDELDHDPPPLF